VTIAKMEKCPRCKLPQEGIYKCQYCGYNLTKYNKKSITVIRKRLKNIVGRFNQSKIVSSTKPSKACSMNNLDETFNSSERRSGTDRRKLRFVNYIPERRLSVERRK